MTQTNRIMDWIIRAHPGDLWFQSQIRFRLPFMSIVSSTRFVWVDNLRTLLIALVVSLHACVTYSHVGGWYFKEGVEPSMSTKLPFLLWEAHLQSFFMGLLFFVSGYF